MTINELWKSDDQIVWKEIESKYFNCVPERNKALEKKLDKITAIKVKKYSTEEFYSFLHDEYFPWKYTMLNRLATTRKYFEYYNSHLEELKQIKHALFSFDVNDIYSGLKITTRIRGLGCAGASGLLSILFPENYGTVDQFVAKSLLKTNERKKIKDIKPENISLKYAVILENIYIEKAKQLNKKNNTTYWTPRRIDKVLWIVGHETKKQKCR